MIRDLMRSFRRRLLDPPRANGWSDYEDWLARRVQSRTREAAAAADVRFSILTAVYNPPPSILRETIASVESQTWSDWEWVVIDNGSTDVAVQAMLDEAAARDRRIRVQRSATNLGIFGGMRRGLESASGDFVVPLDHDDVLTSDALEVIARAMALAPGEPFLYSDEDVLKGGRPIAPYFRPDWDPVLNMCTSYVFHLCAFRRDIALAVGVFTDTQAEYVQDWDTIFRFLDIGAEPLHVAEVLYHWRAHEDSTTNRADPSSASLASQRRVLELRLAAHPSGAHFEIARFPVSRGAPEFWLRRKRTVPAPMALVVTSEDRAAGTRAAQDIATTSAFDFKDVTVTDTTLAQIRSAIAATSAELVAVTSVDVVPEGDEWPWEAQGLMELHSDVVLVGGRILNSDRITVAGGEVFDDGCVVSPDYARPEWDPGPWGLALKQRSAGACHPAFFAARTSFLGNVLANLPAETTAANLGAWLGLAALMRQKRVAYSPLITAVARVAFGGRQTLAAEEAAAFGAYATVAIPPPGRWYPMNLTAFGPARA